MYVAFRCVWLVLCYRACLDHREFGPQIVILCGSHACAGVLPVKPRSQSTTAKGYRGGVPGALARSSNINSDSDGSPLVLRFRPNELPAGPAAAQSTSRVVCAGRRWGAARRHARALVQSRVSGPPIVLACVGIPAGRWSAACPGLRVAPEASRVLMEVGLGADDGVGSLCAPLSMELVWCGVGTPCDLPGSPRRVCVRSGPEVPGHGLVPHVGVP